MKQKIIALIIFLIFSNFIFGIEKQFVNMNPNPDGEPWYLDFYTPPENPTMMSDEARQQILKKTSELPARLDHSFSKYMRPVFNQVGGSCGSASRICYMFGYELNNHRDLKADNLRTQYPSHFTWLLTGQNSGKAEMAIFNGVPNGLYYNGNTYSTKYGGDEIGWPSADEAPDYGWMNGYNRWENAANNRLLKNEHITLNTPENLQLLKSWIYNHHGDTTGFQEGGVAGAGVATGGMSTVTIPSGEYESGKHIVKNWGPQVDHGTTWSGYDDSVGYDFNDDGQITNDIDINGDGIIDMKDWERGALIMLNSWGDGWKNSGTVYVPYRLLKINNMSAEFYHIRKNYSPEKVMKIKMDYNKRSDLKFSIGISTDTSATVPEKTMVCHHFNYAGNGEVPMLGRWADGNIHDEPMEFCFDLTDLMENMDVSQPYDFYFKALAKRFTDGEGTIYSVSVVDYENNPNGDLEYFADISELSINGGDIHYIPVKMPAETGDIPDQVYLPQSAITVHFVDSEETEGEDGDALNVLDGDPGTIWHTEWSDTVKTYPHELQLKLDKGYELTALEYLPRQNSENGRIGDYEIYVSDNDTIWGDPVASGRFANSTDKQQVVFDAKQGSYLRLVALNEVNGNDWASCAEINLLRKNNVTLAADNPVQIAEEFELHQNYPNPFNPSTTISFYIPKTQELTVKIYNLLGREIVTLANRKFTTGHHQLSWHAENFASGLYFYQLTAGETVKTRKMLLQK